MITLDHKICADFSEATKHEWLETNGIGGFASGTVSGARTRRYHALLTAATDPPLGRISTLSKFEETLILDGVRYELSSNRYGAVVYPTGHEFLTSFRLEPFPIWTYDVDGVQIEKKLFMVHGENTTVCRWSAANAGRSGQARLELRPLVSFVDYHALRRERNGAKFEYAEYDGGVEVSEAGNAARLYFVHSGQIENSGYWYNHFELALEQERGFEFTEDLFQPFVIDLDLHRSADIIISTERPTKQRAERLEQRELKRRGQLLKSARAQTEFEKQLVLAADQFIVARGDGQTVIAGYPWFSDWGRDTMIALNGLSLVTNRPKIARSILLEFSKHISNGMLPNRFPDTGGQAEYNTVDATLWYFEAIRAYTEKTGDYKFVDDELYEKLAGIIATHLLGTRYGIHVDTDGLLWAGEAGSQLTWMDAKIADRVITPRIGKPVEIQALWYNALMIMEDFALRFGHNEDRTRFITIAERTKVNFNSLFWNDDEDCLFDVVENGCRDGSVRPNQIFAVSLPFSMLDEERSRKVVAKVEAELLTPVGLRSLSPKDPKYVGVYSGSPFERDSSYHQGTVWAWLIGGFVDAFRKVYGASGETEARITEMLLGLQGHVLRAGVGQISEIFDGDSPHHPRGCPAQAWSVAEVLRVLKNA